ncbi:hypothetical protein C8R46DRAFT_1034453 [Mycena filopes]|nr:hypothetical protein C8R46DRAFT_1034453 [Mycena filopes]
MADYAYAFKAQQQQQHQLQQQHQQHQHQLHQQQYGGGGGGGGYPTSGHGQQGYWDAQQHGHGHATSQTSHNVTYFPPPSATPSSPPTTTTTSTSNSTANSTAATPPVPPQQQLQYRHHHHSESQSQSLGLTSPVASTTPTPNARNESTSTPGGMMMSHAQSQHHPHPSPLHPQSLTSSLHPQQQHAQHQAQSNGAMGTSTCPPAATTLLWTDLEPWMDTEYARQVCALLRWDAGVRVPAPAELAHPPHPHSPLPHPSVSVSGVSHNNNANGGGGGAGNNAGYAVLTFGSAGAAAGALAQVNASGTPMTMPNSARAFVLGWAPAGVSGPPAPSSSSSPNTAAPSNNSTNNNTNNNNASPNVNAPTNNNGIANANANGNGFGGYANVNGGSVVSPTSPLSPVSMGSAGVGASMHAPMNVGASMNVNGMGVGAGVGGGGGGGNPQYPKEYSIFVGDLAPETSNSDLVAVFRNPVLGLRNDRAPKFIRPFVSCKSAKIMLDPVTGVSRGYGFVRFTDESDQQRALIEMHGLYCLSRPMRISPATAKYKPPQPDAANAANVTNGNGNGNTLPASTSYASTGSSTSSYSSVSSIPTSVSGGGDAQQQQGSGQQRAPSVSAVVAVYGNGNGVPVGASVGGGGGAQEYFAQYGQQQAQQPGQPQQDPTAAEWRHHAQARAILGNLIGPNGEQLTSTDPYNTTVFVGGLSPLVGEETLRTFFVPFGEIHYVKVPVGKHCGFVQFVRKADAERAIEKMQGFPVGGSRIRLSWGRNKAAQAAAQAAQALGGLQSVPPQQQLQQQQQQQPMSIPAPVPVVVPQVQQQQQPQAPLQPPVVNANALSALQDLTQEQVYMLLQNLQGYGASPNGYASVPQQQQQQQQQANPNVGGYAPVPGPSGNGNGGGYGAGGSSSGGSNNGAEAYRNGYHSSSPSNSNVGDAYMGGAGANGGGAPQPPYTEEGLKVRREDASPFGYPQQRAYESYSAPAPSPYIVGLPHPSKAYAPGFSQTPVAIGTGSGNGGSGRAGSSPTRGGYGGGGFAGSPPVFQSNRYSQPQTQPISRPNSGSARGGMERERMGGEEFDSMHDLNGTLASLDLDRERELGLSERPWSLKSPALTESASDTSSGGSVQFRMTMGRTPSP